MQVKILVEKLQILKTTLSPSNSYLTSNSGASAGAKAKSAVAFVPNWQAGAINAFTFFIIF